MTTETWVRFAVVGFHRWPDAPERRAYLATRHRHRFEFEVGIGTRQGVDRDIEFHDLLDIARARIEAWWPGGEFGSLSCEDIAAHVATDLHKGNPFGAGRSVRVSVSEDGECGATVTLPGNA